MPDGSVSDGDAILGSEEFIHFSCGQVRQLGVFGIRPRIERAFGLQQGAWCDQRQQEMLVDRQPVDIVHKLIEVGPKPIGERPHDVVQLLTFTIDETKRCAPGTAGVTWHGERNPFVERAGHQTQFSHSANGR